mmetsp:Transcript_1733/g.2631  ORF Transcript_1733/g.2631 Transcript_1733/m.2631 type:complete len:144 (+) Transcript_1733:95-526(+)
MPLRVVSLTQQQQQSKNNSTRPNKSVRFGNTTVRQFERMLGDHPCAEGGAPLSMSPKHVSEQQNSVDVYEGKRADSRRPYAEMKIPLETRVIILKEALTPTKEWDQVEDEIKIIQKSRTVVVNMLYYGMSAMDNHDDDADIDC